MSSGRSAKVLVVAAIWLVVIGAGVAIYKFVFVEAKKDRIEEGTSTPDRGQLKSIALSLDSFSGYCVFRSVEMEEELAAQGIYLDLVDDAADYNKRLDRLASGQAPLAVFTIDALIKASAERKDLPGTIVMVIDESRGADALLAFEEGVPDLDALNRADARIVATTDSPSETLVRVVRTAFQLSRLPEDCWIPAGGAQEVYDQLRSADRKAPRAYSLWEPFVSRALQVPGVTRLTDSSKFQGFIVDVLVAQREFLLENEALVEKVIRSYLVASYGVGRKAGGMVDLVQQDAAKTGDEITPDQARQLVAGIQWRNTLENYAHMGILSAAESQGFLYLGGMIRKITSRVMLDTGAISRDPTGGDPNRLFYDGIFRRLHAEQFRPSPAGQETLRGQQALRVLTDSEWEKLIGVGTLKVDRLVFAPGTTTLTLQSQRSLENLVETLREWPQYYLRICGHASARGDADANRRLAADRAGSVSKFLGDRGIPPARMKATGEEPSQVGGQQQSVSFVLCELPY